MDKLFDNIEEVDYSKIPSFKDMNIEDFKLFLKKKLNSVPFSSREEIKNDYIRYYCYDNKIDNLTVNLGD